MRFHVTHPLISHPYHPELVTGEGVVRLARAAEAAGFDTVLVMDHFYQLPGLGTPDDPMRAGTTRSIRSSRSAWWPR